MNNRYEEEKKKCSKAGMVLLELLDSVVPKFLENTFQQSNSVSTLQLNDCCEKFILEHGLLPSLKTYKYYEDEEFGFCCCISLNDEIAHARPSQNKLINKTDVIKVDVVINNGLRHLDAARTYYYGENKNIFAAIRSLRNVIHKLSGQRYYDLKQVLDGLNNDLDILCKNYTMSIAENLCGHFIGRTIHQRPLIPFGKNLKLNNVEMSSGLSFCIEPILIFGESGKNKMMSNDRWTIFSESGENGIHYEDTFFCLNNKLYNLTGQFV